MYRLARGGLLAAAILCLTSVSALAQYFPAVNGVSFLGWTTATRPTPTAGQFPCGFNSTLGALECWNGTAWGGAGAGTLTGITAGAGLSGGGVTGNVTLSAQWQAGSVTSLGAGLTLTGGVLSASGGSGCFTAGSSCFYGTNTGSPWRGSFEASETSWTPPTIANGQWSFYHSIVLQSVGLTNRTSNVADQWNASLFGTYVEGHGSAALYNSHFVGSGIYTFIPAGLIDGQNGGTYSGGLPGNPNYEEIGGLTAVGEMGSPGDYTENVASYVCDNLGCGTGAGNQSRMTAFLAAVYKNFAGTDYGDSAFIGDSLGTQQSTNAPNSILRGLGGWLVGADFSGVPNLNFVAIELRGGNAIADDLSGDVYVYAANTLVQSWNTSAATFSKPIVYAGTLPTGTAAYAACITSTGEFVVSTGGADCFGGGSASVTSFNTRTGAVTLTSADISGASGFLTTGGTVTGATTFSAAGASPPAVQVTSSGYGSYLYADTLTLHNALAQNYGGFGADIAAAGVMPNGAICIGNNAGCVISTITAGSNVAITNGPGSITISASGGGSGLTVGSSAVTGGTAGYLLYDNSGVLANESVSSLTIGTGQLSGAVAQVNGGFGLNIQATGAMPDGALCIGDNTGCIISTITAGTGITVTNAAGGITIASTGGFSGGTVTGATTFSASGTALTVNNNSELAGTVYTSSSGSSGTAISGTATDLSFYKGATLLADFNASAATFSVSPNTASGIIYYSEGTPGISGTCTFASGASITILGGIVTAKSGC